MPESQFRLEGLISHNEFLERPRHKAPSIDSQDSVVIIDDAFRIDYDGPPARGDYRIGVHLANGGLLYGHNRVVENIREYGFKQPDHKGFDPVKPGRSLSVVGIKEMLSLGTGEQDGAPSLLINFNYNSNTRRVSPLEFSEVRVVVDSFSAESYEKEYEDEYQAKKLNEVVVGINQPILEDLDINRLNPDNKVEEIMVATNRLVAKAMVDEGIPWIFKNRFSRETKPNYGVESDGHIDLDPSHYRHTHYCHVTSPLQHFTDLVNHLNLRAYLKGQDFMYEGKDLIAVVNEQNRKKTIKRQRRAKQIAA